jgi:hypothetical protein
MKWFLIFFLFIPLSYAQFSPKLSTEDSVVEEVVKDAETIPTPQLNPAKKLQTEDLRADSAGTVLVGYQFLTTWIPSKLTFSYTHIFNKRWSLEGEYSGGSISFPVVGVDLGKITEKRYSLQLRRYGGNSFHTSFGLSYSEFKARLGSDFLDDMGNEIKSSFEVENLGLTAGFGNRWQWENGFTLGLDWARINIPLFETAVNDKVLKQIDKGDRADVRKVIRTFNRIPTFVLLGLNLGLTF